MEDLHEVLQGYPNVGSTLPIDIHEDIHFILGYIAKEEAELAAFDRHMAELPPDAGFQWRDDYYNRRGAAEAKKLLAELKADLNAIITRYPEFVTQDAPH